MFHTDKLYNYKSITSLTREVVIRSKWSFVSGRSSRGEVRITEQIMEQIGVNYGVDHRANYGADISRDYSVDYGPDYGMDYQTTPCQSKDILSRPHLSFKTMTLFFKIL